MCHYFLQNLNMANQSAPISYNLEYPSNTSVVNDCICRICGLTDQTDDYKRDVQMLQQHYKVKHPVEESPAVPGETFGSLHQLVDSESGVGKIKDQRDSIHTYIQSWIIYVDKKDDPLER